MAGGGRPPVRRTSSGRRRDGEAAAAAAAASASLLAADLEERRRVQQERPSRSERASASPGHPVSLSVRMHDDPSRKVTLRRLPEEEARHRRGSVSTLSGDEGAGGTSTGPSRRRYRRESATHRSQSVEETAAERAVIANAAGADPRASDYPLVQSNAPSASGRSRPPKDSAYYSGGPPAGPSTGTAPPGAGPAVSSIGSPDSHGTWSGMSPTTGVTGGDAGEPGSQTAEEKRRRRRIQRRNERPVGVDYN